MHTHTYLFTIIVHCAIIRIALDYLIVLSVVDVQYYYSIRRDYHADKRIYIKDQYRK